eukprot:6327438-Lingulodinium_polyedra.AAC.1
MPSFSRARALRMFRKPRLAQLQTAHGVPRYTYPRRPRRASSRIYCCAPNREGPRLDPSGCPPRAES